MSINIIIFISIITSFANATKHLENGVECDHEEQEVEECARKMILIGRHQMPQTIDEMNTFCNNYKIEENCLRNHSMKCLSPAAHQTVTILINGVATVNQRICSKSVRYRKRIINGAKCVNKTSKSVDCLQAFIARIQGIHQLSQNDKIPLICCNYHKYRKCSTEYLSTSEDRNCNSYAVKTIENLIAGYSGDVINYVCDSYESYGQKCDTIADLNIINGNNATAEEIPKTFFSLMVKIYLS